MVGSLPRSEIWEAAAGRELRGAFVDSNDETRTALASYQKRPHQSATNTLDLMKMH
jgi:hypothetical protein